MEDNRYAPPLAAVADPPPVIKVSHGRPARPRAVTVAVLLLILNLVAHLLRALELWQQADFHPDQFPVSLVDAADYLSLAALICLLALGKGWARFVLLMLVLFGFVMLCYALGTLGAQWWRILSLKEFWLNRLAPLVVNFVALHLLYFSSGDWFRRSE